MTRTFKRIIATGIAFILIAAIAVAAVVSSNSAQYARPLDNFTNGSLNTLIDITGVKGHVDSTLRQKTGELAEQLGISQSAANEMVDSLAIQDWRVTTLPADAVETGTSAVKAGNVDAAITTYEDPSLITVGAYGLSLTLEAPESAQIYTPFLRYIHPISQ